jgi:PAS domain S-box-containing protein
MTYRYYIVLCFSFVLTLLPIHGQEIKRTIRVAIDKEYAPYEFVDAVGNADGFNVELLKAIGESAGVQMNFIPMPWPEAQAAMLDGTVDLVNMIHSESRQSTFLFSDAHSRISQAIFTNEEVSGITGLASLAGHSVVLQAGDISEEALRNRQDLEIFLAHTKDEGLLLVNSEKKDAFLTAELVGIQLIKKYELEHVRIRETGLFPSDYCFAARSNDSLLIDLLNLQLNLLKGDGQYDQLVSKWLLYPPLENDLLRRNRAILIRLGIILLVVSVLVIIWNYSLRTRVVERTRDLERSESLLRQQAQQLSGLLTHSPGGIMIHNLQDNSVQINQRLRDMFVITPEIETEFDLINRQIGTLTSDPEAYSNRVMNLVSNGNFVTQDDLVLADGKIYSRYFIPINDGGNMRRQIWQYMDITAQRSMSMMIKENENNLRALLNSIDYMVFVLDGDGRVIWCNQSVYRKLEYEPAELAGISVLELHPEEWRGEAGRIVQEMLEGKTEVCPVPLITKAGNYLPVETRVARGRWSGNQAMLGVTKDLSELQASQEKFQKAFTASPALMALTDVSTNQFIEVNDTFLETLGYQREEVIGKSALDLEMFVNPAQRDRALKLISEKGSLRNFEVDVRSKSGDIRFGLFSAEYIQLQDGKLLLTVMKDITERRRAEDLLRIKHSELEKAMLDLNETRDLLIRQERMAAVGQLSAGIAHDFNNILTTILGHIELLQQTAKKNSEEYKSLADIKGAGNRAAALVQQVLDFTGKSRQSIQIINLAHDLQLITGSLRNILPENIRLNFNFDPGIYDINGDPVQIQRVVRNLVTNARDAISGAGTIDIQLARITMESATRCRICQAQLSGEWIELTISDSGSGIIDDVLPRVFEPFFTTREIGQGSGLGLSQVSGIVMQHNGHALIESRVGEGTRFTVLFPPAEKTKTDEPEAEELSAKTPMRTILLADDDPAVRQTVRAMVEHLGYPVAECAAGAAVVAEYEADPQRFSMLITDVGTPDKPHLDLYRNLQLKHPQLNIIACSSSALDDDHEFTGFQYWLRKPVTIASLEHAINAVLTKTNGRWK